MKKIVNIMLDIVKRKAKQIKAIYVSNVAKKGILRVIVGLINLIVNHHLQKDAIYVENMGIMKLIAINFS
jgi:hypothetical protein